VSENAFLAGLAGRLRARVDACEGLAGLAVIDLATGERIGINDGLTFAVASSIKVALLTSMYKAVRAGRLAVDARMTVSGANHVGGSGVLQYCDHHVDLALGDLATLMIVLSDNTATNMIIDLVGMDAVNRDLDLLGLAEIRLRRKMIDNAAAARDEENTATMRAAAELMRMLWAGEVVDRHLCDDVLHILRKPKRESPVALLLPQDVDIANKPGGLEGVAAEFAIVYLARRPYVLCCAVNYGLAADPSPFVAALSAEVYRYFAVLDRSTAAGRRLPLADLIAAEGDQNRK